MVFINVIISSDSPIMIISLSIHDSIVYDVMNGSVIECMMRLCAGLPEILAVSMRVQYVT